LQYAYNYGQLKEATQMYSIRT